MTLCKFHPRPACTPVRAHTPCLARAFLQKGGEGESQREGKVQAERRKGKAHIALQRGPAARGTSTWPAWQVLRYPPAQALERF